MTCYWELQIHNKRKCAGLLSIPPWTDRPLRQRPDNLNTFNWQNMELGTTKVTTPHQTSRKIHALDCQTQISGILHTLIWFMDSATKNRFVSFSLYSLISISFRHGIRDSLVTTTNMFTNSGVVKIHLVHKPSLAVQPYKIFQNWFVIQCNDSQMKFTLLFDPHSKAEALNRKGWIKWDHAWDEDSFLWVKSVHFLQNIK